MPIDDAFVNSHLPPIVYANKTEEQPSEKPKMSITGLQAGAVKAAIQAAKDRQAQSLTKLAGAASKVVSVSDAMDQVSTTMEKEADDALQELAQFTNGGPA